MTARTSGPGDPGSQARGAGEDPDVPAPRGEPADPVADETPTDGSPRRPMADETPTLGAPAPRAGSDDAPPGEDPAREDEAGEAHDAGEDEEYRGPLDRDLVRRVVGASTAVLATGDRYGERDVAVLTGDACFVRVLDGHRLAFPDAGVEVATALRSNIAEEPAIGMLLVGPGGAGGRQGLHVNGTAEVVAAETLRATHPDLPTDPVPGRSADVWVVVAVGDVYAIDGDDVPPLGALGSSTPSAPTGPVPRRRRAVPVLAALVVLLALALVAAGIAALTIADRSPAAAPSAAEPTGPPAAPPGPTGPPTLYGRVVDVPTPATVVVDVRGTAVTVDVVGIEDAAIPPCARPSSEAFARRTLTGRIVTLVPDPTLAPTPPGTRAYVVLDTQFSYTDAAIAAGAAPASGPAQYRAVFDTGQDRAQAQGVGMWGPPCVP